MIFSLEALESSHGDCLLLHYGTNSKPQFALIDGGPSGVYAKRLRKRLEQLAASRAGGGKLPIPLAMVSHIDDDHVIGLLELTKDLLRSRDDGDEELVSVHGLWHNGFSDLARTASRAATPSSTGSLSLASASDLPPVAVGRMEDDSQLVLASVSKGRELQANARKLGIAINSGFPNDLVTSPVGSTLRKPLGTSVSLSIVGPRQEQLDKLEKDWAKKIDAMKKKGTLKPVEAQLELADFVDKSVYNLASIVVLAKSGSKTMLLTGDARGDYVLQGLEESKVKKQGKPLHVNILKVPHHGSWRNLSEEFFEQVTADHYVMSANGRDDNPDRETIEALFDVRPKGPYSVHFTNAKHYTTGRELPAARYARTKAPSRVKVLFADQTAEVPSIVIDLLDPLPD